ncbi:MAG: hypothetical protein JW809_13005 [Pirellulales bacterium]|nr:hypothetical protein [Pirellulales bacterium]
MAALCPDRGKRGGENLSVCDRYGARKQWRMLRCRTRKARFSERKGTPLFGSDLPEEQVLAILEHIAEGCPKTREVQFDENLEALVQDFKVRTQGRMMNLITSDEYQPCRQTILKAHGKKVAPKRTGKPGRPKASYYRPLRGPRYATVHKTHCFSKGWDIHDAATYFTMYTYNFRWPARTPCKRNPDGPWLPRTPAMAAGRTDRVWPLREWLTFPAVQS